MNEYICCIGYLVKREEGKIIIIAYAALVLFFFLKFMNIINYLNTRKYITDIRLTIGKLSPNQPFFSIIIPVFNRIKYLNRSLKSILIQSYKSFEIVYCDDCSKDGSPNFIQNLKHIYPHITFIKHDKNYGTLNTRVDAIKASTAKYITSLDPDDEFKKDLLLFLYSYLSHEHYDIIEFRSNTNCGNETECQMIFPSYELNRTMVFKKPDLLWSLVYKCFYREILLKGISHIAPRLFNLNLSIAEDMVILSYSLVFCKRYLVTYFVGYVYYKNQPGSSSTYSYFSKKRARRLLYITSNYVTDFLKRYNLSYVRTTLY